MAHFARLDDSNTVIQVIVVSNSDILDDNGQESEAVGIAFCQRLLGTDTRWVQTSYNGNFRKNYAGIGYSYDAQRDAFIPPKPFTSWVLNEDSCQWEPPVPYPDDGKPYTWDDAAGAWVEVVIEPEPLAPERARNADGTFMADDPTTPDVNEAYVSSGF